MSKDTLEELILDHEIIGFFEEAITLKSGRKSHFYVNWRKATNDAWLLDKTTDHLISFLNSAPFDWDCIYGVPEGATKLAILTAFKWAIRQENFAPGNATIPMGRAKPKAHGQAKDKFFIGEPKGQTVVIEDTATTGLSLLNTLTHLTELGIDVSAVVTLTDRMENRDDGQNVQQAVHSQFNNKIQYHTLTRATELLPLAAKNHPPSTKVLEALSKEFEQYGSQQIKWIKP